MGSLRDYINTEMTKQAALEKKALFGLGGRAPAPAPRGLGPLAIILPLLALAGGAYAFRDRLGLGGSQGATTQAPTSGYRRPGKARQVRPSKPADNTRSKTAPTQQGPKGVAWDWLQGRQADIASLLSQLNQMRF